MTKYLATVITGLLLITSTCVAQTTNITASFSIVKTEYGIPNDVIGALTFRPKAVFVIANDYSSDSIEDFLALKKFCLEQMRYWVKESNDKATYMSIIFLTELPSYPSDSDLRCDSSGPIFPKYNKEGKGIYICRLKYGKSWGQCAEIDAWDSNAIKKFVDASGKWNASPKICL